MMSPNLFVAYPGDQGAWESALPYLERALTHTDDWGVDDVRALFREGKLVLLLCFHGGKLFGGGIGEVEVYANKKVFAVHLFGADDHSEETWLALWPQLARLARGMGCAVVRGTGREGWSRKLGARRKVYWELDA
jgi:hypothetical protein